MNFRLRLFIFILLYLLFDILFFILRGAHINLLLLFDLLILFNIILIPLNVHFIYIVLLFFLLNFHSDWNISIIFILLVLNWVFLNYLL